MDGGRRILVIVLVCIVPLVAYFVPLRVPIHPSTTTTRVFEAIEAVPQYSPILVLSENGGLSASGAASALRALLMHSFQNQLRPVLVSLYNDGSGVAKDALRDALARHPDRVEGRDYLVVGFRGGGDELLQSVLRDGRALFGSSEGHAHLLQDDIRGPGVFPLVVVSAANDDDGRAILESVRRNCEVSRELLVGVVCGLGATGAAREPTGYVGILFGHYGAAQYEELLGEPGPAQSHIRGLAAAALAIALLIVTVGSAEAVRYWRQRRNWHTRVARQARISRRHPEDER